MQSLAGVIPGPGSEHEDWTGFILGFSQSLAAVNSARGSEVEGWTGFVLGVFKTGSGAAESSTGTFRNSQAISSIDGRMPHDGALGPSSLTSKGSSSVEIVSLFAS